MKIAKTALLVLAILGLFGRSIERDSGATIKIVPRQVGNDLPVTLLRKNKNVDEPSFSANSQFQIPKPGQKCNAGLLTESDCLKVDDPLNLEK